MSLRVLLADESPAIKKVIEIALKEFEAQVQSIQFGIDVLEAIESFKPHIVFVDVLLQKKDGYAVCADIKSKADIPVILMWSSFIELDQTKLAKSLADDKIEKPFDTNQLKALINKFIPLGAPLEMDSDTSSEDDFPDFLDFPDDDLPDANNDSLSKELGESNDSSFLTDSLTNNMTDDLRDENEFSFSSDLKSETPDKNFDEELINPFSQSKSTANELTNSEFSLTDSKTNIDQEIDFDLLGSNSPTQKTTEEVKNLFNFDAGEETISEQKSDDSLNDEVEKDFNKKMDRETEAILNDNIEPLHEIKTGNQKKTIKLNNESISLTEESHWSQKSLSELNPFSEDDTEELAKPLSSINLSEVQNYTETEEVEPIATEKKGFLAGKLNLSNKFKSKKHKPLKKDPIPEGITNINFSNHNNTGIHQKHNSQKEGIQQQVQDEILEEKIEILIKSRIEPLVNARVNELLPQIIEKILTDKINAVSQQILELESKT